ncbi:MAG: right-handed parallel beta-helix repeat-containing protein, partial [Candidatus Zixiibacteriota bacterium]
EAIWTIHGPAIYSDHNEIRDITLVNWPLECITLIGDSNRVAGCHINVNQAGDERQSFGGDGIAIAGNYNTVGGLDEEDRNVIASPDDGNALYISGGKHNNIYNNYFGLAADGGQISNAPTGFAFGIRLNSADSNTIGSTLYPANHFADVTQALLVSGGSGNRISNNVMGLAANLTDTIPNNDGIVFTGTSKQNIIGPDNIVTGCTSHGIYFPVGSDSNIIIDNIIAGNDIEGIILTGGPAFNRIGPGNTISNCGASGIYILGNSDSNTVIGNRIGGDLANQDDGNGADGIKIESDCDGNLVDSNVIAFNGGNGVTVATSGLSNTITRNQIYNNALLGIDLGNDGVTTNDVGDGDSGPNNLLNYPEISYVEMYPDSSFLIEGMTGIGYVIEFFVSHPAGDTLNLADPSGHGEAYTYIGSDAEEGDGSFLYIIDNTVPFFTGITCTATDPDGNTSEFAPNFNLIPMPLELIAYSPVNLKVIDPAGDSIGKDAAGTFFNTIDEATYVEDPDDSIYIPFPLDGTYLIIIVAEDGAPPGATFSVGIRLDGSLQCIIVEDSDVPASGTADTLIYVVEAGYHYLNGDANRDDAINLLDILCLIDCLYGEATCCPDPEGAGDANCDLSVNLLDILYIIDNLYGNPPGPAPCEL